MAHVRSEPDWRRQLRRLLPGVRATRVDGLALLALGLAVAGSVTLPRVAAALPVAAAHPRTERRLRRPIANDGVAVRARWAALLPALGPRPLFVFDPTPHRDRVTLLIVGVVVHRRALPVAWQLVPQPRAWPARLEPRRRERLGEVGRALPPGTAPTLLADWGSTGAAVVDLGREMGWHCVGRVNAGPQPTNRVRVGGGGEGTVWGLVTGPGQRWAGSVEPVKAAGWRRFERTIRWDRGWAEPGILRADEPAGATRVREGRRRVCGEATELDGKGRGWRLEASTVVGRRGATGCCAGAAAV